MIGLGVSLVTAFPLVIFRSQDNLSPLHVAAGMGHIEVTKRLLDNGAHMEAEDNALYTPLWRAAYYGHPEVVEVRLYLSSRRWEGISSAYRR